MNIIEDIEKWKEKYLSPFCIEECRGYCCRLPTTKISVTKKQITEMLKLSNDPNFKVSATRDLNEPDNYFIATYQNHLYPHCPAFCADSKLCKIQNLKPQMCLDFPIIIKEDEIILHRRCILAEKQGTVLEELKKICIKYNYSLYIE